jgi:hypothetical protein
MPDSKRLRILKAVTDQIETVTEANGYQHELTGRVYRGRVAYGEESSEMWVGVFELRPEEVLRADAAVQRDQWYLGIQGVVPADDYHPTDPAHNLMADVKLALGQVTFSTPVSRNELYMFGGLVADIELDGGMTFVPRENSGMAVFALRLTLTVIDDALDPYEL